MTTLFSMAIGLFVRKVKAAGSGDNGRARGWGDSIRWMSLSEGLRTAQDKRTPMMVVVHQLTCPNCLRLKRSFSHSSEIQQLSQQFVMVNLTENEVPASKEFSPDGEYVPRIMFFGPNGHLMTRYRHDDGRYMYNFSDVSELADTMRKVLQNEG